ncbi:AAA family ATPase [Streptomyces mirabilis]|uniref:AAA family ATPase n=1 Tax=Streptomyces mirabilis TaxID=68239 RepID=UPI0036CC16E4
MAKHDHSLQIDYMRLVGANREIQFNPDLSIIQGEIATGKSTLLRLMRAFLGAVPKSLPPEVSYVSSITGRLETGTGEWLISRPRVTTQTAKVDIAGTDAALRLPAVKNDGTADKTYSQWMLEQIGLPIVEVPTSRTRPESSEYVPVSINDWLSYSLIPGAEIDNMVFGHRDPFRNNKRRYVFEIAFGLYDTEMARLQAELKSVESRLNFVAQQSNAFDKLMRGTALASRDDLEARLHELINEARQYESEDYSSAESLHRGLGTDSLRDAVIRLEQTHVELNDEKDAVSRQLGDLEQLRMQLHSQVVKLSRAIVAEDNLLDFDFIVCPRCGQDLPGEREAEHDHCRLCTQPLIDQSDRRAALIKEQGRIQAQIAETKDVQGFRKEELASIESLLARQAAELEAARAELDYRTRSFVSTHGDELSELGARRARNLEEQSRVKDYLAILGRRSEIMDDAQSLQQLKDSLTADLASRDNSSAAEDNMAALAERFGEYLVQLEPPQIGGAELGVEIDKRNFLPLVGGRSFDEISSQGMQVLVNIAYSLAVHTVCIDRDLPMPGLLALDGISSNTGREGWDARREDNAFRLLAEVAGRYRGKLQIIVIDNDAPDFLEDKVVLRLSGNDRLIRTE